MSAALRVFGSLIFVAAVGLACMGMLVSDGLVCVSNEDGTYEFCRASTGSMAATDEWLLTIVYLVPSALIRSIRAKKRPALLEVALFGFVLYALAISYDALGYDALADTIKHANDRWLAAGLLGGVGAVGVFAILVVEGWVIGKRR